MQKSKSYLMVTAFIALLTIGILFTVPYKGANALVIMTFIINALIFAVGIVMSVRKYAFSYSLIFFIFMYFFMFFAPFIQYTNRLFAYKDFYSSPKDSELIICNLIIDAFVACWIIGCLIFKKSSSKKKEKASRVSRYLTDEFNYINSNRAMVLLFICVAMAVIFLIQNGFSGIVVSRDDASNEVIRFYGGDNQAIRLVVDFVSMSILTITSAIYLILAKKSNKYYIGVIISLACLLICYFPTSIARYMLAIIYFGLIIVVFKRFQKGTLFFWILIFGLFIIFPFMGAFRYSTDVSIISFFQNLKDNFIISYTDMNYDAYQSIITTLRYVKASGLTFGKQLLGAILFFVPRNIWPSKPVGSGAMMMNYFSPKSFSNVSCTFIAESYINFGIIGVLLVPIIVSYFLSKLDYIYHIKKNNTNLSPYVFSVLFFFFMLRGDLMSSFAYSVGFLVMGYVIKKFITIKIS